MKERSRERAARAVSCELNPNFNPTILPGWARRRREVVSLCCINTQFRQNVISATDPRYKRILIQKARQVCRTAEPSTTAKRGERYA